MSEWAKSQDQTLMARNKNEKEKLLQILERALKGALFPARESQENSFVKEEKVSEEENGERGETGGAT